MKVITCPNCGGMQIMEYDPYDKVYFPIQPYCCLVMAESDTPTWNKQLDNALENTDLVVGYKFKLELGDCVVH